MKVNGLYQVTVYADSIDAYTTFTTPEVHPSDRFVWWNPELDVERYRQNEIY